MQKPLSKIINIDELALGMYVLNVKSAKRFVKIKTKGMVKSDEIIKQLKKQGVTSLTVRDEQPLIDEQEENEEPVPSGLKVKKQSTKKRTLAAEFYRSCKVYDDATNTIKGIFNDISSGKKMNIDAINELANDITESIIRNEHAIAILTRIRDKNTYHWEHAINTTILISGFALYIGMSKETVVQIAIGALLHDAGLAKLPMGIINKREKLNDNEEELLKKHVLWGYKICKADGVTNRIITDMLVNHHERLDGSGYPRGVKANKISKLARITSIVDVYDAMTGSKHYQKGEEPINALRYIISNGEKFDRSLVQQFIKYIGVHPVGSLVKLSNETLAIVTEGNREDPLNPKTIAFYNTKLDKRITSTEYALDNEDLTIRSAVKPEDYNINISKVIREIIA